MSFFFRLMMVFAFAGIAYLFYDLKTNHDLQSHTESANPQPIVVESSSESLRALAQADEKTKNQKPVLLDKPPHTVVKAEPMTSSEFREMTRKALEVLPRKQEMKDLNSSDVHHVPSPILSRIRILGSIVDIVDAQPDFKRDAVSFFEKCAADSQIIASVRARCLANFRRHGEDLGIPVDDRRYPHEIVRLSKFIP
jgi:hypothetical protein